MIWIERTKRGPGQALKRVTLGAFLVLASGSLLAGTAQAGHSHHGRHAKVVIASGGDCEGGAADHFDISDLAVGETRFLTTASGKDVEITRQEDGYLLNVDGKEIHVGRSGSGATTDLWVEKRGGVHGVHTMVFAGDDHAGEGSGARAEAHSMIFMGGGHGDPDAVTISGLGDLDENQRQDIIDALRSAGVDKEIHFGPAMGHAFKFMTTCDEDEAGSGDCAHVLKKRIHAQIVGADDDDENEEVVVISLEDGKKAIVKIRTTDDDSSDDSDTDDDSSDSPFQTP